MSRLLESIASKSNASEVEETHPLMFAQGMKVVMVDEPRSCTADLIKTRVIEHNKCHVGAAKIGEKKLKSVIMMLLFMPEALYEDIVREYHAKTWDMMSLNASTTGSDVWKRGHHDEKAKGPWKEIYCNTVDSILLTRIIQKADFENKLPSVDVTAYDCQRARAKDEELVVWSLRSRLVANWIMPKANAEFGDKGVQTVKDMFTAGNLDAELDDIVAARAKAEVHSALNTLYSLPTLRRRLDGKTAAKSTKEEVAENNAKLLSDFTEFKGLVDAELKELEQKAGELEAQRGLDIIQKVKASHEVFAAGSQLMAEEASKHTLTASWPAL